MKKIVQKLAFILLLLSSQQIQAQVASAPPAPAFIADSLQSILENAVTQRNITGGLMGVYAPGRWVWYGGTGDARRDTSLLPDSSFNFRIASISKSFTAIALLQLQEAGVLSLEDTIGNWIGQTLADTLDYSNEITIRQLLNHTAGVGNGTSNSACLPMSTGDLLNSWTLEASIMCGVDEGAQFAPGSNFAYTNTNYSIAALIVENASGTNFANYVDQNILAPAGLNFTNTPLANQLPDDYMGCYWDSYPFFSDWSVVHPSSYTGWAGLSSRLGDLFQYYEAIHNETLINSASYAQMFDTLITNTGIGNYSYGLGIEKLAYPDFTSIGHAGDVGNTSLWSYCPELDIYLAYNMTDQGFIPFSFTTIELPVYELLNPIFSSIKPIETEPAFRCFPNPATTQINLQFQSAYNGEVQIQIVDLLGRINSNTKQNVIAGDNKLTIDLSQLPAGSYFLQLRLNGQIRTKKIIKN